MRYKWRWFVFMVLLFTTACAYAVGTCRSGQLYCVDSEGYIHAQGIIASPGPNTISGLSLSAPLLIGDGTSGTPAYSFTNTPTIGLYNINANSQFGISGKIGAYNGTALTNGQLLIGNTTSGAFDIGTLTAGTAVAVTNAPGAVTVSATTPNPIINSNFDIWQRGTTFAITGTPTYTADRWVIGYSSSGTFTVNQSTSVPTVAEAGVLFNYSLEVDVTAADAAVGATDSVLIAQKIEGYNWRQLAQQTTTVSFWVYATKTGTYSIGMVNKGGDRAIAKEYTVNASNTWERKTVTFAASPSAGTWAYDNTVGVQIDWVLMMGSNNTTATLDSWTSTNDTASTNQVNAMDSASNFFRITGVKIETGSVATPIAIISFEEELARCERYYQKSFDYATAPAQNLGLTVGAEFKNSPIAGATTLYWGIRLPVKMRGAPSVLTYNPNAANAHVRNANDSTDFTGTGISYPTESGFVIQSTGTAGTAVGELLAVYWTADAEL